MHLKAYEMFNVACDAVFIEFVLGNIDFRQKWLPIKFNYFDDRHSI